MDNVKRNKIKQSINETRLKRQSQRCVSIELKIDESHLSKKSKEFLKMYFVEAKWLYNYILSQKDVFKFDYKIKNIQVLDKDKNLGDKELKYLPAKTKQTIVQLLQQNIYSLSKAKKKKLKVGKLKFKSDYNSIDLNQYGMTHKIISKNRIKINGIKQKIKVHGLSQIKGGYEFASAKLIKKPSGYYIKLVCYEFIKPEQLLKRGKEIGLDFGIKDNITTSEGEKINVCAEESERLKLLQRKMNRQQKGSNNRYKNLLKIKKEYEKLNNKKKDVSNKIVNYLLMNYDNIFMQDENIKGWQKSKMKGFGRRVQHSCMGIVKTKLSKQKSVRIIDRNFPTTKMCYKCGSLNNISLNERIFKCDCGLEEDRDIKSAKTILHVGKCKEGVPMGCREFKPVERLSDKLLSFGGNLQISVKQEAIEIKNVVVHDKLMGQE